MTCNRAGAVALTQTVLAKALDNALIALALAGADNVNLVAFCEDISLEDVADVDGSDVIKTELTQGALGSDVSLVEDPWRPC